MEAQILKLLHQRIHGNSYPMTPDCSLVFVLVSDFMNANLFYDGLKRFIINKWQNIQNCIFIGHQNQRLSKKIPFETQHSTTNKPLNSLDRFDFSTHFNWMEQQGGRETPPDSSVSRSRFTSVAQYEQKWLVSFVVAFFFPFCWLISSSAFS